MRRGLKPGPSGLSPRHVEGILLGSSFRISQRSPLVPLPAPPNPASFDGDTGAMVRLRTAPRYFGPAGSSLFGCHHAPHRSTRDCGVVFCYPFGHEYFRAHRAFRLMAHRLAGQGFHALRFDFFGSGDSAGEPEAGSIDRWTNDIGVAVDEIKRLSGRSKVALVGLRLGGSLAALAATQRKDIEELVLWEPVLSGREYLRELTAAHQEWAESVLGTGAMTADDAGSLEVLGFPISAELRVALEGFALEPGAQPRGPRVLVIQDGPAEEEETVGPASPPRNGNGAVKYRRLPGASLGTKQSDLGNVWIPGQVLQAIVSWISEARQ